ncbi:bifunctional phosphoribosylaminoimidazolecarboxamide formyltransferase/IMP cyclohydrolase [cyanobacterium endosymbiont of Epithemia clementina EcSB]|uniref:bifunctional phosphoribosylaminoimidazolecarboxamide formyltransferase/IMP cyclohydrolase n=1 Tax=cyanobacterium endosymbiont of Epithemia clementina EcSB TaxID=3034674 RepID=UPI0024810522|nr:bifunctional phosphoribosylaminoimidazolecarboxamide formyltransferase/IMP cyclohydrolase [cyanobacterium endosymbiont of Epithemia clementina EcSB]WGT67923.1 bifunctional phosphoribosylaminoimidazolecarboxamide formyltransferase/IMP cyclohydrolase [cyanobacterium endosymbiont of Epithemia clementina EcSB]
MARLALLSVSDKTGIIDLAQQLVNEFDFELISSGGTADVLQRARLPVTKVSDYTGSPEILGGRVKTLHPRIHGGILGRRDLSQDGRDMESNQIHPIDLVVVNLYPFEKTIVQPHFTMAEAIEKIDIGGPTLLRAASKNFVHVTVLSNPQYYDNYLQELNTNNGEVSLEFRQKMAMETFALTHSYDGAITNYFMTLTSKTESSLPSRFTLSGTQFQSLRYGENPHQNAVWYQTGTKLSGWAKASKLQGKELSYNNLVDLEAARRIIAEFNPKEPAVAILKHTNPCGMAIGKTLANAYEKAFNADSISAFGGIVAVNRPLDKETASQLTKTFLECVVAPGCDEEAKVILAAKSKIRVLLLPDLMNGPKQTVKVIAGGLLVQASDDQIDTSESWEIVTEKQLTPEQLAELLFAWKVTKHVKSNAIVVTKNRTTLGIGAGQMNRVGAVRIALEEAGNEAKGGFLASDGFFPFDDSVRTAAAAGIVAIIQPGGSLRDKDSIAAANELGLVMVLTGRRHFLH